MDRLEKNSLFEVISEEESVTVAGGGDSNAILTDNGSVILQTGLVSLTIKPPTPDSGASVRAEAVLPATSQGNLTPGSLALLELFNSPALKLGAQS
jgi:hypothetical protein